ncbi:MAG: hypothetical protein OK457_04165 [Thaumarchaeota archaeon]|nr:hypothetical protein [Nitrososphaerota archaeon]
MNTEVIQESIWEIQKVRINGDDSIKNLESLLSSIFEGLNSLRDQVEIPLEAEPLFDPSKISEAAK